MRWTLFTKVVALAGLLALHPRSSAAAGTPDIREVTLDNGMKLLLAPQSDQVTVAAGWVAKVGSVNERPGITGLAHLFEHLMFKGSHAIGTRDIEADLKVMADLDRVRAELRAEQADLQRRHLLGELADPAAPSARSPRHRELLTEFETLTARQGELMVKNEFDKIYSEAGGSRMNATTNTDSTLYFITVPSNKLELWFWMESDRLAQPVLREFYTERDVVREERRLRVDSTPTGVLDEQFEAMCWQASPYSWPVIGWPSDLDAITKEEAEAFYDRNYSPNNLTAVLVGGFDPTEAERLARKYFGRLERAAEPPSPVRTMEPRQVAVQRLEGEADTNPRVMIRWHAVPFSHVDHPALDVLTDLLSGRTGRLTKSLVHESKIATTARASLDPRRYGGLVEVSAVAAAGHDPVEIERALETEVRKLQDELVGARELQSVKNRSIAEAERQVASPFSLMFTLLYTDALSDWRDAFALRDEILQVTPADVQRVARQYLRPEGRNIAVYRTKAGAPADPDLAAFTPDQRKAAEGMKAQIDGADAARLKQAIERFAVSRDKAPADFQPVLTWAERRARTRLETLEAKP